MRPYQYFTLITLLLVILLISYHNSLNISGYWAILIFAIYISFLMLGAIYIGWNFYIRSYHRGTNPRLIALTFDDGPNDSTNKILDILKQQNTPASFFCIGRQVTTYPDLVKRIDNEGHLLGNHSYNHGFNFDWKTAGGMKEEIDCTNKSIESLIGKTPKLFRPPYGVTNPTLAKAIKRTNMRSIGWSIRSFDTTAKDRDELLERILIRLRGGDIILLHDTVSITSKILTELIIKAQKKGYTFVRVDELLDLQAYA